MAFSPKTVWLVEHREELRGMSEIRPVGVYATMDRAIDAVVARVRINWPFSKASPLSKIQPYMDGPTVKIKFTSPTAVGTRIHTIMVNRLHMDAEVGTSPVGEAREELIALRAKLKEA